MNHPHGEPAFTLRGMGPKGSLSLTKLYNSYLNSVRAVKTTSQVAAGWLSVARVFLLGICWGRAGNRPTTSNAPPSPEGDMAVSHFVNKSRKPMTLSTQ